MIQDMSLLYGVYTPRECHVEFLVINFDCMGICLSIVVHLFKVNIHIGLQGRCK